MVRSRDENSSNSSASVLPYIPNSNQHRVHFSPFVSQLSYSQNPQYQASKSNENHGQFRSNYNPRNNYSAPYYYSHLDSRTNCNYRDEISPPVLPPNNENFNGHIEKVKVQQMQRPSQEKAQRVVMPSPQTQQGEFDPMRTKTGPVHNGGHFLGRTGQPRDYPDLLQSTPSTSRKEKVDLIASRESSVPNTNDENSRENSVAEATQSKSALVNKNFVDKKDNKSASNPGGSKKSGFAHRLSLLKKFVIGGGSGGKLSKENKKSSKNFSKKRNDININNSSRSPKARSCSLISNSSLETGIEGDSEGINYLATEFPDYGNPYGYPVSSVERSDVDVDDCCDGTLQVQPTLTDKFVNESTDLFRRDKSGVADSVRKKSEDEILSSCSIKPVVNNNFGRGLPECPVNNGKHSYPPDQRILQPSPRLRKLIFKNKYSILAEDIDDATDELSANVEKILEDIAGLEHIMENSGSLSPKVEEKHQHVASFSSEIADICAGLNELSSQTSSLVSTISRDKSLIRKPPLPPSSRNGLRNQFFRNSVPEDFTKQPRPLKGNHKLANELDKKLCEFREELHRSREEIVKSYPNFEEIENSVRSSMAIDRFGRNPQNSLSNSSWENSSITYSSGKSPGAAEQSRHAESELLKEWNSIIFEAKVKLPTPSKVSNNGRLSSPDDFKGILETDLDSGTSREFFLDNVTIPEQTDRPRNPDKVVKSPRSRYIYTPKLVQKSSCSMQNLTYEPSSKMSTLTPGDPGSKEDRSRSMEFLLDDSKNAHLLPPENTLKKTQENRQPSDHELRIQRSLQRLNVPEWYKNYATPGTSGSKPGGREFGSGTGLAGGWSGLSSSKTSSLTSLQSAGRYTGSRSQYSSRHQSTGPASTGGRNSRESLMSPSSTASASPSPYYERSSFTYGMPYALSRFATARMSCGASPASLSPSPSPVGGITSSTSTPVSSGPMSRYGYNKTPYLGWRSQERLNSKTHYRSPSERLAADLLAQKHKVATPTPIIDQQTLGSDISIVISPKKETASDLSLNTSDESNSNKLNRVRSSIKEVSNAIVDYVNETKPLDDGINGRASPRRGLIWLESSFVGTKPIDSPSTPDTPSVMMSSSRHLGSQSSTYQHSKRSSLKFDEQNGDKVKDTQTSRSRSSDTSQAFTSYISRNEKMGERSNSSSVSSPTLEDILDSLLALPRPPHKKIKSPRGTGHQGSFTTVAVPEQSSPSIPSPLPPQKQYETPVSDWQERMNQPLDDSAYFPADTDSFMLKSTGSNNQDNHDKISYSSAFNEDSNYANTNPQESVSQDGEKVTEGATSYALQDYDSDVQEQIAQEEESAFGTPTEIHTTMSSIINNPLAGLNESSNPPTPARNRRVSFDLDFSDKDEKSSSRSRRDESIGGTIQCRNSKCAKTATGLEARREFKTCHNCNAYYCSRECRRIHWEKHKKVCMQSRVGQLCKQIISHVKDDSFVVSQLSTVAKRGFLAKGRGCVKLFYSSPDRAERFLTGGLPELPEPWYIPHSEMLPEEMGTQTFSELSENCRNYNPETRFVLYASVCVVNEVPTSGAVKWEREMISRSAKIRLLLPRTFDENQPHHHAAIPAHINPDDALTAYLPTTTDPVDENSAPSSDNETLILRSVPTPVSQKLNSTDDRRRREVSFTNIQKHLIERGVELRRTYPDIYSKLCNYVENDEPFLPVTIYPRNAQTGRQFMCVIMPESSDPSYGMPTDPTSKIETINISEL